MMTTDNGKEHKARLIADYLLDGSGETWTAEQIFTLMQSEGWRWNGAQWKIQPEATR